MDLWTDQRMDGPTKQGVKSVSFPEYKASGQVEQYPSLNSYWNKVKIQGWDYACHMLNFGKSNSLENVARTKTKLNSIDAFCFSGVSF